MSATPRRRIAIVGGGVSGVLTAVHLARLDPRGSEVTLFERAGREARGIAYDTREPDHLLNVRAANMSAFPDDPAHFDTWIADHPFADDLTARTEAGDFVPRALYGRYLEDILRKACLEDGGGCIAIRPDEIRSIRRDGRSFVVKGAQLQDQSFDDVVLAMGNVADSADTLGPVFRNPWSPNAVRALDPRRPVMIMGTGLTMIDLVVAIRRQGFEGEIIALSRRGLLPHRHAPAKPQPPVAFHPGDAGRVSLLLHRLRSATRAAISAGGCWRPVIDGLRPMTQALWQGLTPAAKARFLRHVRPFWDAHRHRIAEPVAGRIARERESGKLTLVTGRAETIAPAADNVTVTFRPRGGAETRSLVVQRLIMATGVPGLSETGDTLVRDLVDRGLARLDPLGIGIDVGASLGVTNSVGVRERGLWALGPIVRGMFWECTAVPDIRVQAQALARTIVAQGLPASPAKASSII